MDKHGSSTNQALKTSSLDGGSVERNLAHNGLRQAQRLEKTLKKEQHMQMSNQVIKLQKAGEWEVKLV